MSERDQQSSRDQVGHHGAPDVERARSAASSSVRILG